MDTMARWEDPALPRQYAAMQILIKHKGSKMTQSNRGPVFSVFSAIFNRNAEFAPFSVHLNQK